jgi:hypothetical protein
MPERRSEHERLTLLASGSSTKVCSLTLTAGQSKVPPPKHSTLIRKLGFEAIVSCVSESESSPTSHQGAVYDAKLSVSLSVCRQ